MTLHFFWFLPNRCPSKRDSPVSRPESDRTSRNLAPSIPGRHRTQSASPSGQNCKKSVRRGQQRFPRAHAKRPGHPAAALRLGQSFVFRHKDRRILRMDTDSRRWYRRHEPSANSPAFPSPADPNPARRLQQPCPLAPSMDEPKALHPSNPDELVPERRNFLPATTILTRALSSSSNFLKRGLLAPCPDSKLLTVPWFRWHWRAWTG
jgi:hypothetical protein